MDDNFSWKIVYIATAFSLVILGLAYYLISPRDATYFTLAPEEKLAEFKNTRIEGRKDGQRAWEFYARYGWTDKGQSATFLNEVTRGTIFSGGRPLVTNLTAPRVTVYRRAEIVEASGRINAVIDLGRLSFLKKQRDLTVLTANFVRYLPNEKRSEITGEVVMTKKGTAIRAGRMLIDHEKKVTNLLESVRLDRRDGRISAEAGDYYGETEKLDLAGQVFLALQEKAVRTLVRCGQATMFNDSARDVTLRGSLEVAQGKKLAIAPAGVYSRRDKALRLFGGTKTILEKGQAILKTETIKHLESPNVRQMLKDRTVLTAAAIVFSTRTGDARASGSVEVTQKGRAARSEKAAYDDKRELLTLSGNVYLQSGTDWINCQQVVVDVKHEVFEATGVSKAKLKL